LPNLTKVDWLVGKNTASGIYIVILNVTGSLPEPAWVCQPLWHLYDMDGDLLKTLTLIGALLFSTLCLPHS
jgi:hypothetical protein